MGASAKNNSIVDLQTSIRAAVAAGIAVYIAQYLQLPYPLYAMISAVIVTDISISGTRKLCLPRLAGTVLGAGLGAVFSIILPSSAWSIGVGIFISMYLTYLSNIDSAAKLAGYLCAIVMLSYGDHPWRYAMDRLCETSLGIGIALAISCIPKILNRNIEPQ